MKADKNNEEKILISIRLTPKASKNSIRGWVVDEQGDRVLKVFVTTVPEKGKANKTLIALLAKEWKIPKSSIDIIKGSTDRLKTLSLPASATIPDY